MVAILLGLAALSGIQSTVVLMLGRRLRHARRTSLDLASDNARLRVELATRLPLFSRRQLTEEIARLHTENKTLREQLEGRRGAN